MVRPCVLVSRFAFVIALALSTLNMIGCGSGSAATTGNGGGGGGNNPPVVSFSADKTTITAGQLAVLSWSVSNAASVTIAPPVGEDVPALTGSANVAPAQTTTYTLTATGTNGATATQAVTITVNVPPPTITLTANPTSIISGQSSTLTFNATNATGITIDNGVGTVQPPSGTVTVSPTATTTYTATATGLSGTVTASATVTVAAGGQLAATISANPASITAGQTSNLTWTAQNAASVSISGIGPVTGTGGTIPVSPSATTVYTITATDSSSNTVTASATVTVLPAGSGLSNIKHIVFLIQENRSFDNYFGMLGKYRESKGLTNEIDGLDTSVVLVDKDGHKYHPFHSPTVCIDVTSPGWNESHFYADRKSDGTFAMDHWVAAQSDSQAHYTGGRDPYVTRDLSYFDQTELPYYYELATQFATSDRWFSSLMGPTIPNRMFLFTGTSFGWIRPNPDSNHPQYSQKTIFDAMSQAGVQWKYYYRDGSVFLPQFNTWNDPTAQGRVRNISEYYSILADPNADNLLAPVVFLEQASVTELNEHPSSGNFQNGAADTKKLIDALMNSAAWKSSVFILAYDEGGGLYDHVPPIQVPTPDSTPPNFESTDGGRYDTFTYSGFRTPVVVVSPWVKKNFVSHTPRTFISILKLIETRFGVPPLTARDAAADDMEEFFDFSNPSWMTPPPLPDQPTNGLCDRTQEVAPQVP